MGVALINTGNKLRRPRLRKYPFEVAFSPISSFTFISLTAGTIYKITKVSENETNIFCECIDAVPVIGAIGMCGIIVLFRKNGI